MTKKELFKQIKEIFEEAAKEIDSERRGKFLAQLVNIEDSFGFLGDGRIDPYISTIRYHDKAFDCKAELKIMDASADIFTDEFKIHLNKFGKSMGKIDSLIIEFNNHVNN